MGSVRPSAFGLRPSKDGVTLTDTGRFVATFGLLRIDMRLDNIEEAHITTDYRWWTAIGARVSFVDDGLTFGTNAAAGVCIDFREKVPSAPRRSGHSALTVTVADPEGLIRALGVAASPERTASTKFGDGRGTEVTHFRRAMFTQNVCGARSRLVIERGNGNDDCAGREIVCIVEQRVVRRGHVLHGASEKTVEAMMLPRRIETSYALFATDCVDLLLGESGFAQLLHARSRLVRTGKRADHARRRQSQQIRKGRSKEFWVVSAHWHCPFRSKLFRRRESVEEGSHVLCDCKQESRCPLLGAGLIESAEVYRLVAGVAVQLLDDRTCAIVA